MKLGDFIDGLMILREYFDNRDGYHIGAEHDQFYVYKTDKPLTPEHFRELIGLGWFQPDLDQEEGQEVYYPEEGWSVFT